MKFGQRYRATLLQEDYPKHWGTSIISYKQLKKCINKLRQELASIGLDRDTIVQLAAGPLQNISIGNTANFKPKLIFTVADATQFPLDVSLEREAKAYLKALVPRLKLLSDEDRFKSQDELRRPDDSIRPVFSSVDQEGHSFHRRIEIPLNFDSTFFRLLSDEMISLNALRAREELALTKHVKTVGQGISRLIMPSAASRRILKCTDLYAWREIFSLYIDCQIFFSTVEQEKHDHNSFTSQNRLQGFLVKLEERGLAHKLKKFESKAALQGFIQINIGLLQNLKFQELNTTAARKIMKKFEKRTALGNVEGLTEFITTGASSSSNMAKTICFEISEKVVALIPQLNDYECPVCSSISYKPIRLRCSHVFCIRCMILLQRSKTDHCPLCRGSVVMQADERNLDPALMNFLKMYFPAEVKAKQKENEHYLAIDQFGANDRKCEIM